MHQEFTPSAPWHQFKIEKHSSQSLTGQIHGQIIRLIEKRGLSAGGKLPSVRNLAKQLQVSTFPVSEAYSLLMSEGWIISRSNAGYFVLNTKGMANAPSEHRLPSAESALWPDAWIDTERLQFCLRKMARHMSRRMGMFSPASANHPLHKWVQTELRHQLQLDLNPHQLLLTRRPRQCLPWLIRTLLRPGQHVLVEDPGCPDLKQLLRLAAIHMHSLKRGPHGYAWDELQQLMHQYEIQACWVNPVLQNPLGSNLAPDQLARLQDLCKTHQCWLIEDDTMRAFCSEPFPSLCALDGLNRSIYMGDLSLGIAPCLQLGFMAFPPTLLENPGVLDSLGVLLPSEVEVELAYLFVKDREYKRHLGHVRHELRLSNLRAQAWIQQRGLHALVKDTRGPYLSVAWPQTGDFALDTPPGLELVNGATFELESQNAQNWFRLSITPFSST